MNKLNRNYSLLVGESLPLAFKQHFLEVKPPFTVEFSIDRSNLSSAKIGNFKVYNLSSQHRAKIRHDFNDTRVQPILFNAGYGDDTPLIFNGRITQAWSVRNGVNFISEIVADDSGYTLMNGNVDVSFSEGTPYSQIIRTLMGFLPGVSIGAVGNFPGTLKRGNAYSGNAAELLNQITQGAFYIDNGKAYAINDNEHIAGGLSVIDASTGLIGTPIRENYYVRLEMIFEPRVIINQRIFLSTSTGDNLSGFYKVTGIRHRGIISPTVSGEAITELTLFNGDFTLI